MPHSVAFLGFSEAERKALASYLRLARDRGPGYERVVTVTDAVVLVADADHAPSVQLVLATDRLDQTVFVGSAAPPGSRALLPRPVDALRLLRALDALVAPSDPAPAPEPEAAEPQPTIVQLARRRAEDDFRASVSGPLFDLPFDTPVAAVYPPLPEARAPEAPMAGGAAEVDLDLGVDLGAAAAPATPPAAAPQAETAAPAPAAPAARVADAPAPPAAPGPRPEVQVLKAAAPPVPPEAAPGGDALRPWARAEAATAPETAPPATGPGTADAVAPAPEAPTLTLRDLPARPSRTGPHWPAQPERQPRRDPPPIRLPLAPSAAPAPTPFAAAGSALPAREAPARFDAAAATPRAPAAPVTPVPPPAQTPAALPAPPAAPSAAAPAPAQPAPSQPTPAQPTPATLPRPLLRPPQVLPAAPAAGGTSSGGAASPPPAGRRPAPQPPVLNSEATTAARTPKPPKPRRPRPALATAPQRALIVDDSPVARRFLETRLGRWPLKVDTASNSQTAVEMLTHTPYDLVFLDDELGDDSDCDGLTLCQRIKHTPALIGTVVVMVSVHHGEIDRVRGALAGCDAYLAKPLVAHELDKLMERQGLSAVAGAAMSPP